MKTTVKIKNKCSFKPDIEINVIIKGPTTPDPNTYTKLIWRINAPYVIGHNTYDDFTVIANTVEEAFQLIASMIGDDEHSSVVWTIEAFGTAFSHAISNVLTISYNGS